MVGAVLVEAVLVEAVLVEAGAEELVLDLLPAELHADSTASAITNMARRIIRLGFTWESPPQVAKLHRP
jgi:hypothetical protein